MHFFFVTYIALSKTSGIIITKIDQMVLFYKNILSDSRKFPYYAKNFLMRYLATPFFWQLADALNAMQGTRDKLPSSLPGAI
ncbi:hypothetical protein CK934_12590 [Chitinophaga sp. MD30]|nr:hypothetical protein CK934_12590 [Chitinophaga sp. MD30]